MIERASKSCGVGVSERSRRIARRRRTKTTPSPTNEESTKGNDARDKYIKKAIDETRCPPLPAAARDVHGHRSPIGKPWPRESVGEGCPRRRRTAPSCSSYFSGGRALVSRRRRSRQTQQTRGHHARLQAVVDEASSSSEIFVFAFRENADHHSSPCCSRNARLLSRAAWRSRACVRAGPRRAPRALRGSSSSKSSIGNVSPGLLNCAGLAQPEPEVVQLFTGCQVPGTGCATRWNARSEPLGLSGAPAARRLPTLVLRADAVKHGGDGAPYRPTCTAPAARSLASPQRRVEPPLALRNVFVPSADPGLAHPRRGIGVIAAASAESRRNATRTKRSASLRG